jgi:DNA-binding response OmpR family regulator
MAVDMSTRTLLILDDDRSFVDAVALFLEDHGYQTIGTYRGEEAVLQVQRAQVDLAIVDVNLPGIDGFEVLRQIRSAAPKVPVILISSDHDASILEQSRLAGAWMFLEKPLAPDDLLSTVGKALRHAS